MQGFGDQLMVWKRAAIVTAIACLALVHPFSAETVAAKAPRGSVYLMRGLANVFSLGLDDLNEKLHKRGVNSIVLNYSGWLGIAQQIENRFRSDKSALPVILMGHSFGADATLLLSGELAKHNIPVALIVEFDVVSKIAVPSNVRHVINFYESNGNGLKLHAARGFNGRLDNIDLSRTDPSIGHLNIEKNGRLHARAIAAVLGVLGR
jgi:hypothetical protein